MSYRDAPLNGGRCRIRAHDGTFVKQELAALMALLTIHDVAQWLTMKPSTLYSWVAQRKIPALKIHGIIRFQRDDIEAWLQECQVEQPSQAPSVKRRGHSIDNVDSLIARAKAEVYNSSHGKPDQDRATRKGEPNGSI
jgi:excisionase family DNA binding protein